MNEEKHPTQWHTNSNFLRIFEALIRNLESECLKHHFIYIAIQMLKQEIYQFYLCILNLLGWHGANTISLISMYFFQNVSSINKWMKLVSHHFIWILLMRMEITFFLILRIFPKTQFRGWSITFRDVFVVADMHLCM